MIKRSRLEEAVCGLLGNVIGSTIGMSVARKEREGMLKEEARRYNEARYKTGVDSNAE